MSHLKRRSTDWTVIVSGEGPVLYIRPMTNEEHDEADPNHEFPYGAGTITKEEKPY